MDNGENKAKYNKLVIKDDTLFCRYNSLEISPKRRKENRDDWWYNFEKLNKHVIYI